MRARLAASALVFVLFALPAFAGGVDAHLRAAVAAPDGEGRAGITLELVHDGGCFPTLLIAGQRGHTGPRVAFERRAGDAKAPRWEAVDVPAAGNASARTIGPQADGPPTAFRLDAGMRLSFERRVALAPGVYRASVEAQAVGKGEGYALTLASEPFEVRGRARDGS